jgi:uncharacterized protein YjdB
MHARFSLPALLLIALALTVAGCTNPLIDSLAVSPTSQSLTVGQTVQFTATGTVGHGSGHPSTTQDDTDSVLWTSSSPSVATVSATGLATAVSAGTTTISASMNGYTGNIAASATITVTSSAIGGGTTPTADVTTITLIPGTQSVAAAPDTSLFIPIGTTSAGATVNLTGLVAWASSSNQIGTINSSGIATAVSEGSTTITAIYTNADKTVATGTATFQVLAGAANEVTALTIFPGSQAATSLGQQGQFTVLGTEGGVQYDLTGQVTWTSSMPSVATIDTAPSATPGLVTAAAAGSTTIEASFTNSNGSKVITTAGYSVTAGSSPEPLLSINVVPAGITVSNQGMTAQYLAFGTYSTPPLTRDITNEVTWISLLPDVASINSNGTSGEPGGLATAEGYTGFTPIYAEDTKSNPDGTIVLSNSQTFTCKDPVTNVCDQEVAVPQFATVSVFAEGENTFVPNLSQIGPDGLPYGEYITAPSDTGTPNLIHCDSSGSSSNGTSGSKSQWNTVGGTGGVVCTGTYEEGSTITLTENLPAGSTSFGGWSTGAAETLSCSIQTGATVSNTCGFNDPTNPPAGWFCNTVTTGGSSNPSTVSSCFEPIPCTPAAGHTLANSQTCTLPLYGNVTVGVIFY